MLRCGSIHLCFAGLSTMSGMNEPLLRWASAGAERSFTDPAARFSRLSSAWFYSLGDSRRRIFVFTLQEFEFHILGWSDAAFKGSCFHPGGLSAALLQRDAFGTPVEI